MGKAVNTRWEAAPLDLTWSDGDAHVWRVQLDVPPQDILHLSRLLAEDEARRAARFVQARHRQRFIVARAALRSILALYIDVPPGAVRFVYGQHGKPALAADEHGDDLRFNVSHSDGLALCAVTWDRGVGIDVQSIRAEIAHDTIAEHYFSPREVAALRALPWHQQTEAFFACWTRKEAYIKALGKGLAQRLDQFDVSLLPGEPAALLATRPDAKEAGRWSMYQLDPGEGYAAALVVASSVDRVACWDWSWHLPRSVSRAT